MKDQKDNKQYGEFMRDIINGIDVTNSSKWAQETRDISHKIRNGVEQQLKNIEKDKEKSWDLRFLDYCNLIKSLLAVYNFGNLDTEETLVARNAEDKDIAACKERRARDKNLILVGVDRIIQHVGSCGYDITPKLEKPICWDIFGNEDDDKVVPLTMSATTVFTTLVYLRRAFKRIKLFTADELVVEGRDLNELSAQMVADLMCLFYNFACGSGQDNGFMGWGATLDKNYTKAATLSDTYAVVDALGRFDDAFTKTGDKRDQEFIDKVNAYASTPTAARNIAFPEVISKCQNASRRTAFYLYNRTKKMYGKSVFYADSVNDGGKVAYTYTETDYRQIASSSRSSALFNPLYVAMITMYGYNDNEVVIRRFIETPDVTNNYYKKYRDELVAFAADKDGGKYQGDWESDILKLISKHEITPDDTEDNNAEAWTWTKCYKAAEVLQKFLGEKHPEELMNIADYRDYLNATKDAIDQVQILYRDFDNRQRLGVIDTDYAAFSTLDVDIPGEDANCIAKLNKANIAVNNLRPMLLSSKIMIVNALTKYPQADMVELYEAIKRSHYTETNRKKTANVKKDKEEAWVWNEDAPDMNSTARHCEAITYDYFDYYEKYELGFKAMQAFRKEVDDYINKGASVQKDGSFSSKEEDKKDEAPQLKQLVLEVTRQNVDLIKTVYQKNLAEKDAEIAAKEREIEEKNKQIEGKEKEFDGRLELRRKSYEIGETIRGWIRDEIEDYFKTTISMAIINLLNGHKVQENLNIERMFRNGQVVDANIDNVRKVWKKVLADLDKKTPDYEAKVEEYDAAFKKAMEIEELLVALNVLQKEEYTRVYNDDQIKPIQAKNDYLEETYSNDARGNRKNTNK